MVIIALFMFTLLLQNRNAIGNVFKAIVVLSLGCCIVASPLLVFSSQHSPGSTSMKLQESIFFHTDFAASIYTWEYVLNDPHTVLSSDGVYFFNLGIYNAMLVRGLIRTLLSFNAAGLVREHLITAPLAGSAGAALFIIGMFISLSTFRQRRSYLLLYWFIINILLLSTFNTFPPRHQHMVSVIPLIALWTGLGLVSTINEFSHLYLPNRTFRAILMAALAIGIAIAGLYSYFVRMPANYRPEPEQIMAWSGLYAQGEKIVYVYDKPEPHLLKPYFVRFILPDFPYRAISIHELATQLSGKTIVFFPRKIAPEVKLILLSNWSNIPAQRTFYDASGAAILQGAANFQTDFGATPGLAAYLSDSYVRPGLGLVLLLVIFLIFALNFHVSWLKHTPGWVKKTYLWVMAEPPTTFLPETHKFE
jgi:hypothetical protein